MAFPTDAVLKSNISATLKEVWTSEEIERQLAFNSDILRYIGTGKGINETGKYAIVPIETVGNVQSVARLEGQALGEPGKSTEKQAQYDFKSLYIQFQLSGQSIAASSTSRQAIADQVKRQPSVAVRDFAHDMARQVYGVPQGSGIIAKCGVTAASQTVVLDPRWGWSAIRAGHLEVGRYVDIGTTADADDIAAKRQITAVSRSATAPTITISGAAVSTDANDYISVWSNRDATTGASSELTSLNAICAATGTVGGLDTSTTPQWFGSYNGNSGTERSISNDLLLTALNTAGLYGASPDLVATNPFVRQKFYTSVFQPLVQYVDPAGKSSGAGFHKQEAVQFEGRPVLADNSCPKGQLFMLGRENLKFFSPTGKKEPEWMPGVNGILNRVSGYDAYQADAYVYCDLGTSNRSNQVLVDDISE
jgi:hypothetical protein